MPKIKKRQFRGNKHTGSLKLKVVQELSHKLVMKKKSCKNDSSNPVNTASYRKVYEHLQSTSDIDNDDDKLTGYRMINIENLCIFLELFSCPNNLCKSKQSLKVHFEKKTGIASEICFICEQCLERFTLQTSDTVVDSKVYDVNQRFQWSMFGIGRHHKQAGKFCGLMNMPPPVSETAWRKGSQRIHAATKVVCEDSMSRAGKEQRKSKRGFSETVASFDGTWQRKGFQSKNGVVTCLSVSDKKCKVLDCETLTNYCGVCVTKRKMCKSDAEFEQWYMTHQNACLKNHEGSAGAMEPAGVKEIYTRSEAKHHLQYTGYLGDGDSKSYSKIAAADPPIYAGKEIKKLECCGHVQKRMGRRLTDKITNCKKKTYHHIKE